MKKIRENLYDKMNLWTFLKFSFSVTEYITMWNRWFESNSENLDQFPYV